MYRRYLMEAKAFYERNMWLCGFNVIIFFFTTAMALIAGWAGYCYDIAIISMLLAFTAFFRLGCSNRDFLDIEDMFTCFFHVFQEDLHYYLAEDEIHKMSTRRKRIVLFYRFLLLVVAGASVYFFLSLFEKSQTDKSGAHLFLAAAWAIIYGLFNLAMAAFLERRYRKNYGE